MTEKSGVSASALGSSPHCSRDSKSLVPAQRVISAFVALVIILGVAWNLPDSPIRRSVIPIAGPVASAAYINQTWALFAPDVPKRIETVEVHVTMADGAVRVWAPRRG